MFPCKTFHYNKIYFDDSNFFMLYENFYYMIFTGHSAGKIWSSICMQDSVKSALHYQTNVIRLI